MNTTYSNMAISTTYGHISPNWAWLKGCCSALRRALSPSPGDKIGIVGGNGKGKPGLSEAVAD